MLWQIASTCKYERYVLASPWLENAKSFHGQGLHMRFESVCTGSQNRDKNIMQTKDHFAKIYMSLSSNHTSRHITIYKTTLWNRVPENKTIDCFECQAWIHISMVITVFADDPVFYSIKQ